MLISIEGTDSSGKQTQTKLLHDYLEARGYKTMMISFPNYESDSSALVKMYLNGDFGKDPGDVSAQAASIFYACDRFASYRTSWKKNYDEGYIIISDRYTSSNIVNQASKIEDESQKNEFIEWIENIEYNIFSIPRADKTIFLNMPHEKSQKLMKHRKNKISGEQKKDIHESNDEYLKKSYDNALEICSKLSWTRIDCVDNENKIKSQNDISMEIIESIEGILNEQ